MRTGNTIHCKVAIAKAIEDTYIAILETDGQHLFFDNICAGLFAHNNHERMRMTFDMLHTELIKATELRLYCQNYEKLYDVVFSSDPDDHLPLGETDKKSMHPALFNTNNIINRQEPVICH